MQDPHSASQIYISFLRNASEQANSANPNLYAQIDISLKKEQLMQDREELLNKSEQIYREVEINAHLAISKLTNNRELNDQDRQNLANFIHILSSKVADLEQVINAHFPQDMPNRHEIDAALQSFKNINDHHDVVKNYKQVITVIKDHDENIKQHEVQLNAMGMK
jgi:CTP synthase (UTP-ammonia lyase)